MEQRQRQRRVLGRGQYESVTDSIRALVKGLIRRSPTPVQTSPSRSA